LLVLAFAAYLSVMGFGIGALWDDVWFIGAQVGDIAQDLGLNKDPDTALLRAVKSLTGCYDLNVEDVRAKLRALRFGLVGLLVEAVLITLALIASAVGLRFS